ncbi:MAG: prolipoprotein diacylglyceryl transferase, partial [Candidatus Omnitrophica bacterium]|nr:prolipoprotein diacylglyceryl transferase [Candidatus Omnitrophota bacterium]
ILLVAICVFLVTIKKRKPFDGFIFVLYLMLDAIMRFFMDLFRGDELVYFYSIRLSQFIALVTFICAAGALVFLYFKNKKIVPEK